jgi:hypothetical protein
MPAGEASSDSSSIAGADLGASEAWEETGERWAQEAVRSAAQAMILSFHTAKVYQTNEEAWAA